MAITWGTPRTDSTNGFRVGYEFTQSPSTITSSTTRVVVTVKLYVGTRYPIIDSNNTFSWSGSFGTGSQSVNINARSGSQWSSANVVHAKTLSRSFNAREASAITSSVTARMTGIEAVAGDAVVYGVHTTPAKPLQPVTMVPSPPYNVRVFRGSDTSQTVQWTNNSSSTRPYQDIRVERWNSGTSEWHQVSFLRGVGISVVQHIDRTTVENRRYRYRVRAENSAGASSWGYTEYISTSPLPPRDVQATQRSDASVVLSWRSTHIHGLTGFDIVERIDDNNWNYPGVRIGPEETSWTDVPNPSATTRQYAIRAVAGHDDPVVFSDYVQTQTLTVITPPNAPTTLGPTGATDQTQPVVLTWQHNAADGSAQSAYEVGHRIAGSTTWTHVSAAGSTSMHTLAADTYAPGDTVEWRVRTWGAHNTASPWSAEASFELSRKPTVTINPGGLWGLTERVRVDWTYGDPDGDVQGAWAVQILSPDSVLMEERTGAGTTSSALMETYLYDDTTYTVRVRVRDVPGLWSDWASVPLSVDYAPPAKPTISAEFRLETGDVLVSVNNPTGIVPTVNSRLYRENDEGAWLLVDGAVTPNGSAVDPVPVFGPGTVNRYRVEAQASSGESVLSDILEIRANPKGCDQWFWLNAGPDFGTKARFRGNPATSITRGREKTLSRYVGRSYPLEYGSGQLIHTLDVSGTLEEDQPHSTEESFAAVTEALAPVCYRDVKGRRIYGSMSAVDFGEIDFNRFMDVNFSIERSDYVEGEPLALGEGS